MPVGKWTQAVPLNCYILPKLLRRYVKLMAMLGGYLGRASDPPPGYQVLWRGLSALHLMCQGYSFNTAELGPD